MADLQAFHDVVARMLKHDNNDRADAEKQYDSVPLAQKISLLYQLYAEHSAAEEIRSMALVLTRRLLDHSWSEVASVMGPNNLKQYTQQILQSATQEEKATLRKKIADVIAQIASGSIDEDTGVQKCGEILQFIEHCSTSANSDLKEVAMVLIESVPNLFGADQEKYLPGIKHIMESCLTHEKSAVRSAAVKAYVSFLAENDEDDKTVKTLAVLVPIVIQVCEHVVTTEEDDDGPIQCLSDLACTVPKALTPYLEQIFQLCFQTIGNTDREDSFRHSSMEVLTSLCESAPNMVKKRAAQHIPGIIQCCLGLMTELEDEIEDWLAVDDPEATDDEESVAVGESSLDRIACALNGKVIMQPFLHVVNSLLLDSDWKKRHAGLMGLSTIGEGCQRSMEPMIVEIVNTITPFLHDEHPRVRYAACNALGQMSTDFAPTLQKKCHEKVVGGLLTTLIDTKCSRVSAHAGAALVNFSEDCPKSIISSYLPAMMKNLEAVLESTFKHLVEKGRKLVLEQVITTIASVADASQDLFIQYYDRLIGPLKYILKNSENDEFKVMRGKTIECISLIGLAVGCEKFANDADEIMNMLADTMPNLSPDDPQCSYMISSWTRICKVLGPRFAPYLPMVMPPVLRAAGYKPDIAVLEDEEVHDDPAWTFHQVGDNTNFGIRTSGLEEKATACEMLVCYAREMKDAFAPYVEQVAPLMIEHLKFIFHEGVRASAAETFPSLLACVKSQGVHAMRTLWEAFLPALQVAINSEVDVEVLSELINTISDCIEELGPEGITADELVIIGTLIKEQLNEYEKRRHDREAEEADEDADPDEAKEELDDEIEAEGAVLARISDVVHSGFKTLGENFFGLIEPIMGSILALLDPRRPYTDRQWGICMIDDLIEFAPTRGAALQAQFVEPMLNALRDDFPEVRQAAAYGFGIMAVNGGQAYGSTCMTALQPLAEMIGRPDAKSTEEGTIATENAISAVAKILKHVGGNADLSQIVPAFMSWLPTFNDQEESVAIYSYFADLVESMSPLVLGPDNNNLPNIMKIMVVAFHNDAFEETPEAEVVKNRLRTLLKSLQQDNNIFQMCIQAANLEEEEQRTLQQLLA